jgi:hypothetical protein
VTAMPGWISILIVLAVLFVAVVVGIIVLVFLMNRQQVRSTEEVPSVDCDATQVDDCESKSDSERKPKNPYRPGRGSTGTKSYRVWLVVLITLGVVLGLLLMLAIGFAGLWMVFSGDFFQ